MILFFVLIFSTSHLPSHSSVLPLSIPLELCSQV
ncbi:hypothetical protein PVAP13_9NG611114 [Panicum virgatum]|uniref:Uncharacterized protein n=1 Tax=Panicum virgatum TaxID=38727 RepID=A0A8T0MXF9_PANVG|nr:hypothetical protein PVAP13_9NG611114 [Panicum virgatum]